MIHRRNLQEFDEMERLFKGLGVRDWTVDVPCPEGNMKDNDILRVPPETGGRLMNYGFGGSLHGGERGLAAVFTWPRSWREERFVSAPSFLRSRQGP